MRPRSLIRPAALAAALLPLVLAAVPQLRADDDSDDRPRGEQERVGVFEDVEVPAGTVQSEVVCVSGHAKIDGDVHGDVVIVAGGLELNGHVMGQVVSVASKTTLGDGAKVDGGVTNVGGSLHRAPGSKIEGQVTSISPFGWEGPWATGSWNPFRGAIRWLRLFSLFLFFVTGLLLAALVPDRIRLISEETPLRLFSAFLFGLLGYMLLFMTMFALLVTFVGIALMPFVYLIFVILKWMAMCGIFHYVGTKLGRAFGRELSLLGALLIGFLPFALIRMIPIPCVGLTVWFLFEVLGFGLLIVTRVGTRRTPLVT